MSGPGLVQHQELQPPGFDKRELPAQAEPLSAHLYAAALVHIPATVDGCVSLAWTWDRTIVSG